MRMVAQKRRRHRGDLDAAGLQREDRRAVSDVAVNHLRLNRDDRHDAASCFAVMAALPPALLRTLYALWRAMRVRRLWRRRAEGGGRSRKKRVPPRGRRAMVRSPRLGRPRDETARKECWYRRKRPG